MVMMMRPPGTAELNSCLIWPSQRSIVIKWRHHSLLHGCWSFFPEKKIGSNRTVLLASVIGGSQFYHFDGVGGKSFLLWRVVYFLHVNALLAELRHADQTQTQLRTV